MKKESSNNDMSSNAKKSASIDFNVPALIRAAGRAVRGAVREHKRAGRSIAAVVDGKVVTIPASRIKI